MLPKETNPETRAGDWVEELKLHLEFSWQELMNDLEVMQKWGLDQQLKKVEAKKQSCAGVFALSRPRQIEEAMRLYGIWCKIHCFSYCFFPWHKRVITSGRNDNSKSCKCKLCLKVLWEGNLSVGLFFFLMPCKLEEMINISIHKCSEVLTRKKRKSLLKKRLVAMNTTLLNLCCTLCFIWLFFLLLPLMSGRWH